jgi:anti-sigma regulatory factor (Ser/Thr protein kinase)
MTMVEGPAATSTAALELELACDIKEVRGTADKIKAFLIAQGCNSAEVADCDLALVEACNNAIEHGSGAAQNELVHIVTICRRDEIELRITDHTTGFILPDSAKLPRPESETGRGLYLIQTLMSSVDYTRGPKGNTLTLVKKRAPVLA